MEEAGATEDTLSRTLLTAQRAAEQTVAEAEQEAERLRGEARGQADELLREARREADEVRDAATREGDEARRRTDIARRDAELRLTQLKGAAERFRSQLQDHLDAHQALLDQVPGGDEPGVPEPEAVEADVVGEPTDHAGDPTDPPRPPGAGDGELFAPTGHDDSGDGTG